MLRFHLLPFGVCLYATVVQVRLILRAVHKKQDNRTDAEKEQKLQEVLVKLKSKKVQVLQELVALNLEFLKAEVVFLAQDQEIIVLN